MRKVIRFLSAALAALVGFMAIPVSAAEESSVVAKYEISEAVQQRLEKGIDLPEVLRQQAANESLSIAEDSFQCEAEEWQNLYILNVVRMINGLKPLSMSAELEAAADTRAVELTSVFSHTRPNGTSCATVLQENGIFYNSMGENIAAGQATPMAVFDTWWNSPGHQANMMDSSYSHVGIGYTYRNDGLYRHYWVQLFIGDCAPTQISVWGDTDVIYLLPEDKIIDDLGLVLRIECKHGISYMPIIEKMCSGYDASQLGEVQTVTVSYGTQSTTFSIYPCEPMPFTDVSEDDWYYDYVANVYYNELMTGLTTTKFGPSDILSRAQFATVLWRMEGEPSADYIEKFTDVPKGTFFTTPVLWASSDGVDIITGYTDGKKKGQFGPADSITREQMALMMYRFAGYNHLDTSLRNDLLAFPDRGNVSDFAKDAVKWAVAEGLITGDNGKLNPQGKVSRAVCATILTRFVSYANRQ